MSENEQNVVLKNRNEIRISGIISVDRFDEFRICATTVSESFITVEGENLVINEVSLDDGIVVANGFVSGIYYDEKNLSSKGGFLKGIFTR